MAFASLFFFLFSFHLGDRAFWERNGFVRLFLSLVSLSSCFYRLVCFYLFLLYYAFGEKWVCGFGRSCRVIQWW